MHPPICLIVTVPSSFFLISRRASMRWADNLWGCYSEEDYARRYPISNPAGFFNIVYDRNDVIEFLNVSGFVGHVYLFDEESV